MDGEGGGAPSMQEMQMQQQKKAEYEAQRASILEQILEPAAKDRLSRLALVKKEKVRAIEESLIAAATSGKLAGKVTEEQLIAMLEQSEGPSGGGAKKSGVVVQRRKYGLDDDDDDDNDDDLM
mmetsp:Transcript_9708/g.16228  ORF Transcript_9708/g.16228 Transcript_9708/m.16228 type:complete len:123 (-) Transcript_9708:2627-2995(-)